MMVTMFQMHNLTQWCDIKRWEWGMNNQNVTGTGNVVAGGNIGHKTRVKGNSHLVVGEVKGFLEVWSPYPVRVETQDGRTKVIVAPGDPPGHGALSDGRGLMALFVALVALGAVAALWVTL